MDRKVYEPWEWRTFWKYGIRKTLIKYLTNQTVGIDYGNLAYSSSLGFAAVSANSVRDRLTPKILQY
jgi:hypothetical protein